MDIFDRMDTCYYRIHGLRENLENVLIDAEFAESIDRDLEFISSVILDCRREIDRMILDRHTLIDHLKEHIEKCRYWTNADGIPK